MNDYEPFVTFGEAHIVTMCIMVLLAVVIPVFVRPATEPVKLYLARLIAVLLLVSETGKPFVSVLIYENPLKYSLPLHLCGVSAFLTAWVLWQRNYKSFEVAYFWGIGGSIPAMLTPDLLAGFPHPSFFYFFISHGLILLGVMYATIVFPFQPQFASVGKAIIATLILMALIAPLNLMLDANYMYLAAKPAQSTLMDLMGDWPWYILSLIIIGIMVYLACYLPFVFIARQSK